MRDRRHQPRFPLCLPLRWRLSSRHNNTQVQDGLSIDLGSASAHIAFFGPRPVAGSQIEAFIDWPLKLDARVPLQLYVLGRVVRESPQGFVLAFDRREFRTQKAAGVAIVA